jgi:hypothetical protein
MLFLWPAYEKENQTACEKGQIYYVQGDTY